MIRRAVSADIPTLVSLGRAMVAESPTHSRFGYSEGKVTHALICMLAQPLTALVIVSEVDGVIDGLAICEISSHWFSDDLVAQEMVVYVAPEKRGSLRAARLVAGLDSWAQAMGAKLLLAGCTTGVDVVRTIELYERLGFQCVAIGVERIYH
jgi:GNAT superfamily N-acetyltransferase